MLDMIATATSTFTTTVLVHESKYDVDQPTLSSYYVDDTPPQRETHECGSIDVHQLQHATPLIESRRSVSCIEFGAAEHRFRTIRIGKDSAELHQLADANVNQLVQTATSTAAADSTNARLARKALRYRKIWANSPEAQP